MSEQQMFVNLCTLINDREKIRGLTGRYDDTEYLDNLINFLKNALDIDDKVEGV